MLATNVLIAFALICGTFAAEKQIKLEDIERDNLNSAKQKELDEQQRQSQQNQQRPILQQDFPNSIPIFAQFDPQQYQLLFQQPYLIQQAPVTYLLPGNSLHSLPSNSLPTPQALTGSPQLGHSSIFAQPTFLSSEPPTFLTQLSNAHPPPPPPQQQTSSNTNQVSPTAQTSTSNTIPNVENLPKEVNIPNTVNIVPANQVHGGSQFAAQPLYLPGLVQYVPSAQQILVTNQVPSQPQRLIHQQYIEHPPSSQSAPQLIQQHSGASHVSNIPVTSDFTYSTIPYSVKQNINVQLTNNPKHRQQQQQQQQHQQQIVYQQAPPQAAQQLYNPYNALLHSQQQKNTFSAGTKSTAAPPVKPSTQTGFFPAQPQNTETINQQPSGRFATETLNQQPSGRFANFRGGI